MYEGVVCVYECVVCVVAGGHGVTCRVGGKSIQKSFSVTSHMQG